ncbi:hypothetical protein [Aeromonas jandaei]|uniref:hypothetical protein n=1 Tax=Aeromonas jandaei TaxID=650 RepID=UPI000F52099D|nr:hypothetical protein [Aeromonas jandaei]RQM76203.1 hypothetical protein EHZ47_09110 [Aeromonas jandaei]
MNVHEQSLALAKAWLDSIDDDIFLEEHNAIAEYYCAGPTVDEFLSYSHGTYGSHPLNNSDILQHSMVYEPRIGIDYSNYIVSSFNKSSCIVFNSILFSCGDITWTMPSAHDRSEFEGCIACNDEDYSLAA